MYICQFDAKDILKVEDKVENKVINKSLIKPLSFYGKDGNLNLRRFKASLDYSLDQIKLKEIYDKVYRRNNFAIRVNRKNYCTSVVSVTFKYSTGEWNSTFNDIYVKAGYSVREEDLNDCCAFDGDNLVAVKVGCDVKSPIDINSVCEYFKCENGKYVLCKSIKQKYSRLESRLKLYKDGFDIDGTHFVRWKRSAGSARVGKCLFVDERLYSRMHKYDMCGIDVNAGDCVDLASLEAYTALTASGIIDTIEIKPEEILVIPDYTSTFLDNVVSVKDVDGELTVEEKECEINNCIWDGQGLIDVSAMGAYKDKGMLLLRNRFFKCCCFNTNIQDWFKDNNITDVKQLNGFTLAKDIKDIKLITTPSSIKYIKFGNLQKWLENVDSTFGIVKHEKKTHYFGGKYVSTHYQLLNSVQMSQKEVDNFLKPTLNYIENIKRDPSVLRYHIKFGVDNSDLSETNPLRSKQDIVYTLLGLNDRFSKTRLYYDFVQDTVKAYIKNLRNGHVLVNGNYSTMFGNPIEMLLSVIGQFDGSSNIGVGNVCTKRFEDGAKLLGSRSPHISISNVYLQRNKRNSLIDKYFNLTEEIVCINSIGENTLERLAGCDFDSDTVLLTDNKSLIEAAEKNISKFKVAVNNVSGAKTKRYYTPEQQCDLDSKTSVNKIGEIVNLSQELNTIIWDAINNGADFEDIKSVYLDVCKLSVMSNLEIDSAKKEFSVDRIEELKAIRSKYEQKEDNKNVKPYFFVFKDKSKGYYIPNKKMYSRHDTTMDYLEVCVNKFVYSTRYLLNKKDILPFSEIVDHTDYECRNRAKQQVNKIIEVVNDYKNKITAIYAIAKERDTQPTEDEYERISSLVEERNFIIGNIKLSKNTMIYLLDSIEKKENRSVKNILFETLFGYPNTKFYEILKEQKEDIYILEETEDKENYDIKVYDFLFKKVLL